MDSLKELPTHVELKASLEHTEPRVFDLLLEIFDSDAAYRRTSLSAEVVVLLASYDWLAGLIQDAINCQMAVIAIKPDLRVFARSLSIQSPTTKLATIAVSDFRYIHIRVGDLQPTDVYDLNTGTRSKVLPIEPLTIVLCDLNVLLIRLLTKIENRRKAIRAARGDE